MGPYIDFRNPAVRDELKHWDEWFLREAPFAGVRVDAVKHMSPGFVVEWLDHMRTLNQGLYAVGEYWAPEGAARVRMRRGLVQWDAFMGVPERGYDGRRKSGYENMVVDIVDGPYYVVCPRAAWSRMDVI